MTIIIKFNMEDNILKTDVLIVGAGTSGMVAALCLAKWNIKSIILEKNLEINEHPKAHELNTRSIEILESIGVLIQDLEREASPISDGNRIAFCTSIENEFGEIDLDKDIDDPDKYEKHVKNTRPYLNISQTEIERVLRKTIKENPYIDLLSGHTWKSVEDMDETVLAEVEDVNNAQDIKIAAKYLLAADGASSPVRKTLEIQMSGHGLIGTFVNAYFEKSLRAFIQKPAKLYWILNPAAAGVFIAHHIDKRWVYNFPIYEPWDDKEEITDEYLASRIKEALGIKKIEIKIKSISFWKMTLQIAEKWHHKNIFLLGDAAHCFPPTGGLGMNSGIGDAHNLGWKIAQCIYSNSKNSLLNSYENERRPVAENNAKESLENYEKLFDVFESIGLPKDGAEKLAKFKASKLIKLLPTFLNERLIAILQSIAKAKIKGAIKSPKKNKKILSTIKEQIPHFDRIGLDLGYIYDGDAVYSKEMVNKSSTVTEYFPSCSPGARFPHLWLNSSKTLSSHSLLDYSKWTLLTFNSDPALTDFNLSKLKSVPIELISISDLNLGRKYQESFLELLKIYSEEAILIRPDGHIAFRAKNTIEYKNIAKEFFPRLGLFD